MDVRSKLIEALKEDEGRWTSRTSPGVLAELIIGLLDAWNSALEARDHAQGRSDEGVQDAPTDAIDGLNEGIVTMDPPWPGGPQ